MTEHKDGKQLPEDRLLSKLRNLSIAPQGDHLTDDEFVEYVMTTVPGEAQLRLDMHLETCRDCADNLLRLFEVVRFWEGETGAQRLADLRTRTLKRWTELGEQQKADPGQVQSLSLRDRLNRLTQSVHAAFRGSGVTPWLRATVTSSSASKTESDDSRTWFSDVQVNVDNSLQLRVWSPDMSWEGREILARIGTWEQPGRFERVAADQVQITWVITFTDRQRIEEGSQPEFLSRSPEIDTSSEKLADLTTAISSNDAEVRISALQQLQQLGTTAATSPILEALHRLLSDPYPEVRTSAAAAVGRVGAAVATASILTALAGLLADADARVRQSAAEAVGQLGAAAATPAILTALAGLLTDQHVELREAAVWAIADLGRAAATSDILVGLATLVRDPDAVVSGAAQTVLVMLEK